MWPSKPLCHSTVCLSDLIHACMHDVHLQYDTIGAKTRCLDSGLGSSLCTCKATQVHLLDIFPVAPEHKSLWGRSAVLHQPKGHFVHLGYMQTCTKCNVHE